MCLVFVQVLGVTAVHAFLEERLGDGSHPEGQPVEPGYADLFGSALALVASYAALSRVGLKVLVSHLRHWSTLR